MLQPSAALTTTQDHDSTDSPSPAPVPSPKNRLCHTSRKAQQGSSGLETRPVCFQRAATATQGSGALFCSQHRSCSHPHLQPGHTGSTSKAACLQQRRTPLRHQWCAEEGKGRGWCIPASFYRGRWALQKATIFSLAIMHVDTLAYIVYTLRDRVVFSRQTSPYDQSFNK